MKPISIIALSDIHLGNNKVPSTITLHSIYKLFNENKDIIIDSDFIIITGDVTDSLLSTRDIDYYNLIELFLFLAKLCTKQNKYLLYLEGTPLHDMGQMNNVFKIITKEYPTLKYRYYTKLGIDYIDEYDMRILHIPDIVIDNDLLYKKIKKLLKGEKADLVLTHTFYKHHIDLPLPNLRDTDFFSNITNTIVINGHDHRHTIKNKVVTVGSTDRLANNEEEAKGFLHIRLNPPLPPYIKHIKNPYAVKHTTMNTRDINKIKEWLNRHKGDKLIYLRLNNSLGINIKKELEVLYPNVRIEIKKQKKKKENGKEIIVRETLEIREDNIIELLKNKNPNITDLEKIIERHISNL